MITGLEGINIDLIERRKEEAHSMDLEQKTTFFESRLKDRFMLRDSGLVTDFISSDRPLTANTDNSAHLLAITAFKYRATGDPGLTGLAQTILDSLAQLDAANGLDGYLPFSAKVQNGSLVVVNNTFKANSYTQLLFAYNVAYRLFEDPLIREKIKKHVALIVSHFKRNDFVLRDNYGREVPYSDLSPTFFQRKGWPSRLYKLPEYGIINPTRRMDALLVIETGLSIIDKSKHPGLIAYLEDKKEEFVQRYGYFKSLQRFHFKLGPLEYPTPSGTWLVLLGLNALTHLAPREQAYATALDSAFEARRNQNNPFFGLLYVDAAKNVANWLQREIEELTEATLSQFPLDLTNADVRPNVDGNHQIRTRRFKPKYRYIEVVPPLPVYSRYLVDYEWKGSPFRLVNPRPPHPSFREFNGIDYLAAYWLLQHIKNR